jgi:ABC-2 type transport system permease protein
MSVADFNRHGVWAIYRFEMARALRTLWQSLVTPVITTSLYFVVFGAAIGSRMTEVQGVQYGAFIVPGLMMLSLFTQSIFNASFGIFFPEVHRHDLRDPVGAGLAARDRHRLCRRGRDQIDRSRADHPRHGGLLRGPPYPAPGVDGRLPGPDRDDLQPVRLHHRHLGQEFRADPVRADADRHPLTFLGGAFYSVDMLPEPWRTATLFNPVVYLISGFRWSFYGVGDVPVAISLAATLGFLLLCLGVVAWIFRTGYRLKS